LNRSRAEIITSILQATKEGATKTRIMYKAYLSYTLVVNYLKFLQENYMVTYNEATRVYRTTERGLKFLDITSELNGLIAPKPENFEHFIN
jgi:predicted transcriptional regulator